ncbi:MAG: type II toxin-antitoxin system ParD family antitoxin [Planctomycetota bacterium]|nr:type II toxin-antitoxin system ParD family antitoxin [Planctomycetota bacterium]
MPYQLPPDIQQSIQAQIASGEFASEDEVLREAMATLESRQRGLHQLRQMVADADGDISAGRVGFFDAEDTKRAVRERLARQGVVD